ncbi:hypothetical protein PoB_004474800 [Plakobranchus ocellatus]|uniref:Uncharacterized protein n=1 Tax=Plakobranchus ocellatus TaxID=259542 RepID=A0AAV4BGG1_9GAST|nr:hypothetical protein PoB_004474800 [Plakobranchus ocellatus]
MLTSWSVGESINTWPASPNDGLISACGRLHQLSGGFTPPRIPTLSEKQRSNSLVSRFIILLQNIAITIEDKVNHETLETDYQTTAIKPGINVLNPITGQLAVRTVQVRAGRRVSADTGRNETVRTSHCFRTQQRGHLINLSAN